MSERLTDEQVGELAKHGCYTYRGLTVLPTDATWQLVAGELQRLRAAIRSAEWAADAEAEGEPCCPWCGVLQEHQHKPECVVRSIPAAQ